MNWSAWTRNSTFFDRLHDLFGVGQVDYLLPADAEPHLDGRLARQLMALITVSGWQVRAAPILNLSLADDALSHLVGDRDFHEEVLAEAGLRRHPAHHAARPLDVAGERPAGR